MEFSFPGLRGKHLYVLSYLSSPWNILFALFPGPGCLTHTVLLKISGVYIYCRDHQNEGIPILSHGV